MLQCKDIVYRMTERSARVGHGKQAVHVSMNEGVSVTDTISGLPSLSIANRRGFQEEVAADLGRDQTLLFGFADFFLTLDLCQIGVTCYATTDAFTFDECAAATRQGQAE